MDPVSRIGTDFLSFMKSSYLTSLQILTTLQDQSARVISTLIDQGLAAQQEGKKVLNDWLTTIKKSTDDYRKIVDESFKRVESYFQKGT